MISKEAILAATRLSQPKTCNIFSDDYKVEECYRCRRVLGLELLTRVNKHLYCYFCFRELQHQVEWHEFEEELKRQKYTRRIRYIRDHPELTLRELGDVLHISHEAVRYWKKKIKYSQ